MFKFANEANRNRAAAKLIEMGAIESWNPVGKLSARIIDIRTGKWTDLSKHWVVDCDLYN